MQSHPGFIDTEEAEVKVSCKRILEDASHFTVDPGGYFLLLVEEDIFTSGSHCIGILFDGIVTIYSLHLYVHN